jgi:peptidoglycan hydrolase CwlO-like protein
MYRTVIIIAALFVVGVTRAAAADSSTSAENRNTEERKGVTVDDLGRGLRSAARNIEKEIPKMGSAIGHAVKKITEKSQEAPSSQAPVKQNK